MSYSKSIKTPAERLKDRLYKINISENVDRTKIKFDPIEFVKMAKRVRKTFTEHGDILSA